MPYAVLLRLLSNRTKGPEKYFQSVFSTLRDSQKSHDFVRIVTTNSAPKLAARIRSFDLLVSDSVVDLLNLYNPDGALYMKLILFQSCNISQEHIGTLKFKKPLITFQKKALEAFKMEPLSEQSSSYPLCTDWILIICQTVNIMLQYADELGKPTTPKQVKKEAPGNLYACLQLLDVIWRQLSPHIEKLFDVSKLSQKLPSHMKKPAAVKEDIPASRSSESNVGPGTGEVKDAVNVDNEGDDEDKEDENTDEGEEIDSDESDIGWCHEMHLQLY